MKQASIDHLNERTNHGFWLTRDDTKEAKLLRCVAVEAVIYRSLYNNVFVMYTVQRFSVRQRHHCHSRSVGNRRGRPHRDEKDIDQKVSLLLNHAIFFELSS